MMKKNEMDLTFKIKTQKQAPRLWKVTARFVQDLERSSALTPNTVMLTSTRGALSPPRRARPGPGHQALERF